MLELFLAARIHIDIENTLFQHGGATVHTASVNGSGQVKHVISRNGDIAWPPLSPTYQCFFIISFEHID